jgi:hypothetical protein
MNVSLSKMYSQFQRLRKRIPNNPLREEKLKFSIGVSTIKAQRAYYDSIRDIRQAEVSVFSQNGEDGILDFILEKCQIPKPTFLELGAGDFSECNSKFVNFLRSSPTYLVDSHSNSSEVYSRYRNRRVNSLFFFESIWIDQDNILDIFENARNILGRIDVLSIDLDGNDFWILRNIQLDSVKVIIVEYNPTLSDNRAVSVPYDKYFDRTKKHYSWKYYGASLEAFIHYLDSKSFVFLGATSQGTNAFFVTAEYAQNFQNTLSDSINYKNEDSREARDSHGQLSFLGILEERRLIAHLPLIETSQLE